MSRFGIVIAATAMLATVSRPARSAPGGTAPGGTAPSETARSGTAPGGTATSGTGGTATSGTALGGSGPSGTALGGTATSGTASGGAATSGTGPSGSGPSASGPSSGGPSGSGPSGSGPGSGPSGSGPTAPGTAGAPIVTQATTPSVTPNGAPVASGAPMPPGMQPVPRRPQGVMLRRWAISVGLGAESMHAKQPAGSPTVGFATFELAGRFRLIPAAELGLSLGGGGAFEGKFSSGKVAIDFHYHFMAEQPMNIYLLAGLGVGSAYPKDNATDVQRKGRGMLQVGVGGELRFDALALDAELRLFGIGENPDVPEAIPSTTAYELSRYGVSGAALVLGATYYF